MTTGVDEDATAAIGLADTRVMAPAGALAAQDGDG